MDSGLKAENLLRALPAALREGENSGALGSALASALALRGTENSAARLYTDIDSLPEAVLDALARDFKIDWWSGDASPAEKRSTLKDAWRVHRILGTKAAVETAIHEIYPHTRVLEWFEYGGESYFFRLYINAAQMRTDTGAQDQMLRRVNYSKNVRSHLDGFIWDYSGEPFGNEPDLLLLPRFIQSSAFSNQRNQFQRRFDGSVLFDGSEYFTVQSSLFCFPQFAVRMFREDVRDRLEGARIWFSLPAGRTDDRLRLPGFRVAFGVLGRRTVFCLTDLRIAGRMPGVRDSLSGARLTMDGMYRLDGTEHFDGRRRFDAAVQTVPV